VFEANLAGHFDILVCAPALQIERLMSQTTSREEAEQSLGMQLPLEEKKKYAHRIVDNSVDLEHTRRQVETLWEELATQARSRELPER
jgi:dephospho-CoA kinase